MNATAQSIENLTLNVTQEIHVRASLETTFAALLEEIGPHNEGIDGKPMPMKIEPWPGGRWYRDLGSDNGHFWGHVQAVKRPTLLEINGPLFMSGPAISNVQYRLSESEGGTLIRFRHTALGFIADDHRAGVSLGWSRIHDRVRTRAEARASRENPSQGESIMTKGQIEHRRAVSRAEWLAARKDLLIKEKNFARQRDALSAERRKLPWVRVEKEYVFDAPGGKETLADLFGGRSQLIVYHFMLGPGWEEGCKSCSFLADHIDGSVVHLAQRDVTLLAVSRAPLPQIEMFKKRMNWRFKWVSSNENDFNHDYHVSFTKDEMANGKVYYNYDMTEFPSEEGPGASVFYKDETGGIFHTYSTYARGLDMLIGAYNYLDLVPKGRDEEGLKYSMAWVRHHDKYSDGQLVDLTQPYSPPKISGATHRSGENR